MFFYFYTMFFYLKSIIFACKSICRIFMKKELPKLDISENFTIGNGINEGILNLYSDYPCHLKAEIFVLCMNGELDATVNMTRYRIKKYDFVALLPESIIQLHRVKSNVELYFMAFSSEFISSVSLATNLLEFMYQMKCSPVFHLPEPYAKLYEDFYRLLIRTYELNPQQNPEILKYILLSILHRLKEVYQSMNGLEQQQTINRNEAIRKEFTHLAIQYYARERTIGFYAQQIGITPTHLSNTIKQTTGKTVIDIISQMVIIDAKAQLKSTTRPIKEISESLHFANVSFFGKFFKRHTGMSPQAYRNA